MKNKPCVSESMLGFDAVINYMNGGAAPIMQPAPDKNSLLQSLQYTISSTDFSDRYAVQDCLADLEDTILDSGVAQNMADLAPILDYINKLRTKRAPVTKQDCDAVLRML